MSPPAKRRKGRSIRDVLLAMRDEEPEENYANVSRARTPVQSSKVPIARPRVRLFQYKTVKLAPSLRGNLYGPPPDIDTVLNEEARSGWRLKQVVLHNNLYLAIFEREVD